MQREADVELVVEAHPRARGDVEGAVHHAVVHLERIGRVHAVRAELRHRHIEAVGEGRAALVQVADAFDQPGLAGDDVQLVEPGQREGAAVEGDGSPALPLEAVERGADVDVEPARVADAGRVVVEAARVVAQGDEGAAQRGGARADGGVLVAGVVGAGGQGGEEHRHHDGDGLPQRDGRRRRIAGPQHRADAGGAPGARVDAARGISRVDSAEREHRQPRRPARLREPLHPLRRLARRIEHRREDAEVRLRSRRLFRRVHALPHQAKPECAGIAGGKAVRREVDAVGAGGQGDVGAVVHQEGRFEFCTKFLEGPRPLQQRAGRKVLAQLHSRGTAGQRRERGPHCRRRISLGRGDQVQADHAAPMTPDSGLEALP